MVAVKSTMQALGGSAHSFSLPNTMQVGNVVSQADCAGKPLLLMFICNHCPYVLHLAEQMTAVANQALADGFAVLAISSNDVELYPQDGPEAMAEFAKQYGFEFPYLYDATQEVAKAYGASCTPDFFVYDHEHRLQYRGQMDASRPGNSEPVTGDELVAALRAVLKGRTPSEHQIPSIGCNIKWRAGNEPDYF